MDEKEPLNKKAIVVVALPILVTVVILVILFSTVFRNSSDSDNNDNTAPITSNIKASQEDQIETETLSKQFLKQVGSFGVESDKITANNIDEMTTLLETDPENTDYYFTSRKNSYLSSVDMIMKDSPLYYSNSEASDWSNDFESLNSAGFTIKNIESDANKTATYMSVNGSRYKALSVKVSFDSVEKMYIEQGSQIGVERSYSIMEHSFSNNSAQIVFVQDSDNNWRIYDIKNLKNEFLLSSWGDPNTDDFASTQFGFQKTDTLTPPNQEIDKTVDGQPEKNNKKDTKDD